VAWTVPLTAVANAALTYPQWNASVRDNLLETAPAKASSAGSIFAADGTNSIAQRTVSSDTVDSSEATTSTSYTDLATAGPVVSTITTGPLALLMYAAHMSNGGTSTCFVGWEISGATSTSASDTTAISLQGAASNQDIRMSNVRRLTGLTPGAQTVTLKYRVTSNTGTYKNRHIIVMGL